MLTCLMDVLRLGKWKLIPAQPYWLAGSWHSAFGAHFSVSHYQNQLPNICPPKEIAERGGSERYRMPPVSQRLPGGKALGLNDCEE